MNTSEGDADRRQDAVRSLEHEIGTLLRRIRRGLTERATQVHPELNATSYMLLSTLSEHGGRRAAELAEIFALDKGSVSRLVHQLLELGLVARSPDPVDGRASLLSVTEEAVRRLDRVRGERREHFDDRLDGWDPSEIEDLAAALARFNLALSDPARAGS
ncbi:MAG TPA: MarR family transcriptional regulator [Marmoricola sp.]